jgi:hypothetical protein
MWIVFPNATAAQNAANRIATNMGIPVSADAVTRRWAIPQNTLEGESAIEKPETRHMTSVGAHQERERPNWPLT